MKAHKSTLATVKTSMREAKAIVGRFMDDRPILAALLLTIVSSSLLAWLRTVAPNDYARPLATAAVGVFASGFILGSLKIILDGVARKRQQRDELIGFVRNTLDDIKSVYDRVERARTLMMAHRSVKTYGDEMRDLINARVILLNVKRAYTLKGPDLPGQFADNIVSLVEEMLEFLNPAVRDFTSKYRPLAARQRVREELVKKKLKEMKSEENEEKMAEDITSKGNVLFRELVEDVNLEKLCPEMREADQSRAKKAGDSAELEYKDFDQAVKSLSKELREGLEDLLEHGSISVRPSRSYPEATADIVTD